MSKSLNKGGVEASGVQSGSVPVQDAGGSNLVDTRQLDATKNCGCSGSYLCPLAVSLWNETGRIYDEFRHFIRSNTQFSPEANAVWQRYEDAIQLYREHMAVQQ